MSCREKLHHLLNLAFSHALQCATTVLRALRVSVRVCMCVTYPQLVVIVKSIQQLDDVAVVTFSQDVDLNHVVL